MYNFINLAYSSCLAIVFHRNERKKVIRCDRGREKKERELLDFDLEMVRGGMSTARLEEYRENLLNRNQK